MEVINQVVPNNPQQIKELIKPGPKGPVFMVNLLKFKETADYTDGRKADLTGEQAYEIYSNAVANLLTQFRGQMFFLGDVNWLQLGYVEELWDKVAIAVYPDREALLKMSSSREWSDISVHREAGLAGQLNIECVLPEAGKPLPWIELLLKSMESRTSASG